jgi:hypothetical protein
VKVAAISRFGYCNELKEIAPSGDEPVRAPVRGVNRLRREDARASERYLATSSLCGVKVRVLVCEGAGRSALRTAAPLARALDETF